MASEYRRRTLLTWSVIGGAGYGLKRALGSEEEEADARAEKAGKRWHEHAIEAFAVSPDGQCVATGSRSMSDSISDESEGVVLWSVEQASGVRRVPLKGGVKRAEAPFSALTFSPDGSRLGALTGLNEVSVIEVASGRVLGHHPLSAIEQSPRFFFSQNGEQLFVAATRLPGSIGEVVDARGNHGAGRPVRFDSGDAVPFRLDERGVHVVAGSEYRIIPPDGPPTTVAMLLPTAPRSLAVDVSRRHLAVTAAPRIATVDLESGQSKLGERSDATSVSMSLVGAPLGFSRRERAWEAYSYDESLEQKFLFTADDVEGERLADALPAALSPDGRHALELVNTGGAISWSLGRNGEVLGTLGPFKHACGVCWPREDRAVVFGPQLLAFCDPVARTVQARFEFTRR